jgi:hypothetical protein
VPDWIELVKSRLGKLGTDRAREAEIVAKLAAHLEDVYGEYSQEGCRRKKESAVRSPRSQVGRHIAERSAMSGAGRIS